MPCRYKSAMTLRYEILLFVHISAAIVWIGAGVLIQILVSMAERARDEATFATLVGYTADLSLKLFVPASLTVVVFGSLVVADGPYTVSMLWVTLGLIGFAITFLTGLLVLKPKSERVAELAERDGGVLGPDALLEARQLVAISRIDYVVLFAVVFDMVAKPTGDDTTQLVIMAVGVVAGLALVLGRARQVAPAAA
jgi:uncharacterized membrane protein